MAPEITHKFDIGGAYQHVGYHVGFRVRFHVRFRVGFAACKSQRSTSRASLSLLGASRYGTSRIRGARRRRITVQSTRYYETLKDSSVVQGGAPEAVGRGLRRRGRDKNAEWGINKFCFFLLLLINNNASSSQYGPIFCSRTPQLPSPASPASLLPACC